MAISKNAVAAMESHMTADQIHKARQIAEREIIAVRLVALRVRQNIKQTDMKAFSQASVSKLEKRKDMKISTLIEYLEGIGMGMEIRVYPKGTSGAVEAETLLKV